ncbi:MAG: polyprenyl synthetase family protein [Phycisphaerales bacterium]|nr:MAG: polyprenyl synthetase family protein [Phycisphaerales bacterium]
MTILSTDNTHPSGVAEQRLRQIFRPVEADLRAVGRCLDRRLQAPHDTAVREVVRSLERSAGKRLRPALVLLSSRAVHASHNGHPVSPRDPVPIAAAMELIHMASLVHDDFIDAAPVRHHRSSINARWGGAVSVALGDYLCAGAFHLTAECGDPQMFAHLGSALCAMCEGEMLQVLNRGNLALSEQDCLVVVEKKTAALFAACCAAGAAAAVAADATQECLRQFGLHLGIAFQILDDCKDLLSDQTLLGKKPAQDLLAGDMTLPLLLLLKSAGRGAELRHLQPSAVDAKLLNRIRRDLRSSEAGVRAQRQVRSHTDQAREALEPLAESDAKLSLCQLADFIGESVSEILAR